MTTAQLLNQLAINYPRRQRAVRDAAVVAGCGVVDLVMGNLELDRRGDAGGLAGGRAKRVLRKFSRGTLRRRRHDNSRMATTIMTTMTTGDDDDETSSLNLTRKLIAIDRRRGSLSPLSSSP
jgi:hypothetical protein